MNHPFAQNNHVVYATCPLVISWHLCCHVLQYLYLGFSTIYSFRYTPGLGIIPRDESLLDFPFLPPMIRYRRDSRELRCPGDGLELQDGDTWISK